MQDYELRAMEMKDALDLVSMYLCADKASGTTTAIINIDAFVRVCVCTKRRSKGRCFW